MEQVVDLDGTDDVYNWPIMYGVEVGHWMLPDDQAQQLREYLLRGGFLMVDDFHGEQEWRYFTAGMSKVFPDREIVDLDNRDPIFHTIYDLNDRFQIPGAQYFDSHRTYEPGMGGILMRAKMPHWRGIYDTRAGLWWRFATTWIWAMPGNIPTRLSTRKNGRGWLIRSE